MKDIIMEENKLPDYFGNMLNQRRLIKKRYSIKYINGRLTPKTIRYVI